MDALIELLKKEIRSGKVLAVVGAGVSLGATSNNPVASWPGLLKHGASFCTKLSLQLPPGWEERIVAQIDSDDVTEMTLAAQNVAHRLAAPSGGDFRRWLRESVGSLSITNDATIQAIVALNLPIATTNYDNLLSTVSNRAPVVWTTPSAAQRWSRNDQQGVLHLHGHWESSESIVLGITSYEEILRDEATQSLLRNLLYSRTLLFVGYGGGLTDPNFDALLKWSRRVLSQSEYIHFRLVLNSKVDQVRSQHGDDRIRVIGIGDNYDTLPSFLRSLGSTPKITQAVGNTRERQVQKMTEGRADLFRRKALLDERKATLSADEYISELSNIAEALAKMGGNKGAVMMLNSPLSQTYETIQIPLRTEKGLFVVDLLLKEGDFKFAQDMLRHLYGDVTSNEASPSFAERFWSLSASCFASLFDYENANAAFKQAIECCSDEQRRIGLEAQRDEFQFLRGIMHPTASSEDAA